MKDRTVAIAGAGVSGLACGILLARSGWQVTIYEQFDQPAPVGSGLLLQPTGVAALERMDLYEQVVALGHPIKRLHGLTHSGRTVFDLSYAPLGGNFSALAIHRGALHQVLLEGFHKSGGTLVTGCCVRGTRSQTGGDRQFIDQSGEALPPSGLLIDASGTTSFINNRVSAVCPRPFAYGALWATVPDIGIARHTLAQRYVDTRIMVGYLPLGALTPDGQPLAAFFWSLKPAHYQRWRDDFHQWREQVVTIWPQLSPLMEHLPNADALNLASYSHFTSTQLSLENLVLIGDAAHSTSPQLGQGANQGLIDAVVLVDALGANNIATALAVYQQARCRHVRFYQHASALMTPFFQSDSRVCAWLRDLTFDRMGHIPLLRREMARTLAGLKTGLLSSSSPSEIVNSLSER